MNFTEKLKKFQLGLTQSSTFTESVRAERIKSLRPSLHRRVDVKWEGLQIFVDNGRTSAGYLTIDIDKTDRRYLLAGTANGAVEIFDLDAVSQSPVQHCRRIAAVTKPSLLCHKSHCNWVQWYPTDNGIFVTSSHDKVVKVWDANEMAVVEAFTFTMPVNMHDMVQGEQRGATHSLIAVATEESNVRIADIRTGAQSQHLYSNHKKGVMCVQWSPYNCNILLSAGYDGRILAWDVRSGKSFLKELDELTSKTTHRSPVTALKFTPQSSCFRLTSLTLEGELRIWDAMTLNLIRKVENLSTSRSRTVKSIGIDFACHTHSMRQDDVIFIPSGSAIDSIYLATGQRCQRISGHLLPTYSCVYRGPDYQELYTAGCDRTIECYRPAADENPDFQTSLDADKKSYVDQLRSDDWSDTD